MGYQFFEFQSSRGNQINCALMRIRVDDRTVDVQFFFIDVHQGEGNGGADLRYAEQKNRPTRPGTFDCLKCCLRIADALNNDRVCANLCSDFSPDCDRLTQKHVCCATQLGQLHHQESNRAASDHKNVAAGADTGLINAVYRTGKRFDHRSCVQVGILRQHEALCLRQNAEFRKAAIRVDTQRKQMLTVLLSAFPAGAADTAVHVGIRRDFVAGAAGCDRRANCGHNAGKLMPEHDRRRDGRRARLAFVNMNVRAANAARVYPHENICWGKRAKLHVARFKFDRCICTEKISSFHVRAHSLSLPSGLHGRNQRRLRRKQPSFPAQSQKALLQMSCAMRRRTVPAAGTQS